MKTPQTPLAAPARLSIIRLLRLAQLCTALGCVALACIAQPAKAAVTEAWVQRYDGPANSDDQPRAIAVDASGNVAVTGTSFNGTNWDCYTAKYAAGNGALVWEHRYNGLGNGHDYGYAVAVDTSGNVVVTGSSYSSSSTVEYYTVKYAAADGAVLWEKHYNSPSGYAAAIALALDSSGNVAVTGSSFAVGGNMNYYTAKYAAADSALLWEHRYNSPVDRNAYAKAVAIDSSGNVIVTGRSQFVAGRGQFYYTAKYAAADGRLLWEKRYNGPGNGNDKPGGVAVDSVGNVVVTGSAYDGLPPNNGYSSYMAKYAAANGALLWKKSDSAFTASTETERMPVVVDASGNVVVTGMVTGMSNGDYYTAKYAAADGALLWEKRCNGPANGDDRVSSLALGPNGMVAVIGSSVGTSGNQDFATVVYWESLPAVSIAMVPEGVRLRFSGVPGRSYNIERAPAATGPWSIIITSTAPLGGLIEFVDTNAPAGPAFYRTSVP